MPVSLLDLRMGNYSGRRMNHKFVNGIKIWKLNMNTITSFISRKEEDK